MDDLAGIVDAGILALVSQRFKELGGIEGCTLEEQGTFWLIEAGDTINDIEAATGCWINTSLFSECRYGDPDYSPSFEILEAHPTCWEAVWIFSDAGFSVVLFIPNRDPGIDAQLQAFCREFASPAVDTAVLP